MAFAIVSLHPASGPRGERTDVEIDAVDADLLDGDPTVELRRTADDVVFCTGTSSTVASAISITTQLRPIQPDADPADTYYIAVLGEIAATPVESNHLTFDVTPNPPTVTSITPNSGTTAGGTPFTFDGNGADTPGMTLTVGGVDTGANGNEGGGGGTTGAHAAGAVDVVILTADGTDTLVGGFTYTAAGAPRGRRIWVDS